MWRSLLLGLVAASTVATACARPPLPETTCIHLLGENEDVGSRLTASDAVALGADATLDEVRRGALVWGMQQDRDAGVYCVGIEGDGLPDDALLADLDLTSPSHVVRASECRIGPDGVTHGEDFGVAIDLHRLCVEDPERAVIEISVFHASQNAFGSWLDVVRGVDGSWSVVATFHRWIS